MSVATRRAWIAGPVLLALLTLPVHAQSSASGSLPIAATVVAPLSLTIAHSLDFGKLLVATSKTVAANSASGGRFTLDGQGGSNVTVTLLMPSSINPTSGPTIPINGWNYIISDTPAFGGSGTSFASGAAVPLAATFAPGAGSTKMYWAIGATVTASGSAVTGAYSGVATITVAYTDL